MKLLVRIGLLCLSLLGFIQPSTCAYPFPEPCYGAACANPPKALDYQDFSVIKRVSDGKYFRFAKSNSSGEGLTVATADTLRGTWEYKYQILRGALKDPQAADRSDFNLWAPEIHYFNSLYHIYYTISGGPNDLLDLCVATSPSMNLGSWTDHGSMGVPISKTTPEQGYVRLDGNLLTSSDDTSGVDSDHYMVFGSSQWGLYGFPVSSDLLTMKSGGKVQEIIVDQYNTGQDAGNRTEGPFQFRNGKYIYLFYSKGDCCPPNSYSRSTVYKVQVCRALGTDGPTGPYHDRDGINCLTGGVDRVGTTVLSSHGKHRVLRFLTAYLGTQDLGGKITNIITGLRDAVFAPGSPGIIDDPDEGGLVMYYQYRNTTDLVSPNIRFGFNYLEFDAEDWPVLVAKRTS